MFQNCKLIVQTSKKLLLLLLIITGTFFIFIAVDVKKYVVATSAAQKQTEVTDGVSDLFERVILNANNVKVNIKRDRPTFKHITNVHAKSESVQETNVETSVRDKPSANTDNGMNNDAEFVIKPAENLKKWAVNSGPPENFNNGAVDFRATGNVVTGNDSRQDSLKESELPYTTKTLCKNGRTKPRGFLLPSSDDLLRKTQPELTYIYWNYINTIQILCYNQTRLGSILDGGKEICIDSAYKPGPTCLVYSFGSNFQFDFEEDVHARFGCEIHTFDPSMTGVHPSKIPPYIKFHLFGLGNKDYVNEEGWSMRTLESLMIDLKHKHRIIDILKIDMEGDEWTALPNIFKSEVHARVKQLSIEVHYGESYFRHPSVTVPIQLKVLRQLYENDFLIFMREHNPYSVTEFNYNAIRNITIVNEISLLNSHFIQC